MNSIRILAPIVITEIASKMKESVVVSMTGFVSDPREEAYKTMIQDLRMRLAPVLSEQTSVLIVNDVSTEKYKIAKTYDTPISCVSIDWLFQCRQRKCMLSTANYQIRKLFYGVEVKIVGFEVQKATKLKKKVDENGGNSVILTQNSELSGLASGQDRTSLILTHQANFHKLKHYLNQIPYPIVDLEWMEDSLRSQMCKYPFDYALNQFYIFSKEPIQHLPKMKKKLDLQLCTQPIDQLQPKILDNTYIHLSSTVNPELSNTLKKLIMVFGGFYLDEFSPIVTHILTEPITEHEHYELKNYGVLVHIVRVEWLIDSIYIHKRMKQEDYMIRSFKPRNGSSANIDERGNSMFNSMSLHSMGVGFGGGMSVPTLLNNRKSISVVSQQKNHMKLHPREVKVQKKYESTVFKGYRFYVESNQKKEIELHDLSNKIHKNGGQVCPSRADIREGHCFYILKDSSESNKLIEQLKKDTRGKAQLQPVSYRWVNECLSKNQFIDLNKVDSYIYKPFNFKTPILGFHKMIFEVLGVDDVHKLRIKELYNTLGSARNMANKAQITHCLCGPSYTKAIRYHELKRQNTNVKYLSWKWLIECSNKGKIAAMDSFLMEKDSKQYKQNKHQQQTQNLPNDQNILHLEQLA